MSVTLLHLSDTHLYADQQRALPSGANPYAALAAVLDAAIADLNGRHDDIASASPDRRVVVLITGDFTQDDSLEAHSHIVALVRARFPAAPVYVCEGNHGAPDVARLAFFGDGGANSFTDGALFRGDAESGKKPRTGVLVVRAGEWDVVMLSTFVADQVAGEVSNADLATLHELLLPRSGDGASLRARPVVVALHHPPFSPLPEVPGNEWTENCLRPGSASDSLRALLWRSPAADRVRLVLHGHIHSDWQYRPGDADFAAPAATATATARSNEVVVPPLASAAADAPPPVSAGVERGPLQLCAPATCHQSSLAGWGRNELRHGCRIIELRPDGSFAHRAVWAPHVCRGGVAPSSVA
jgi:3',5'-cyclic AMP phosphodiesterase CpdA